MESTSSTNSFSTSKQKDAFLHTWYPNGVPIGERVAESMSLARVLPKNYESLNTESDISELADFEHTDLMPTNESVKAGISVSSANRSLGFDGNKSVSTRENLALVSSSLTRSQVNDLEVITGTRLSMDVASLTLSDGKLMNQNVGTLWQQLMKERKDRQECLFLLEQLQENYDVLLQKYAKAENIIDVMRIRREIEDGPVRPLPSNGSQMARIRYTDCDKIGEWPASKCAHYDRSQTSHRNREHRKQTAEAKHRRCAKEDESGPGAARPTIANNSPNTNLGHKPCMISIRLRANCLKDQINFTKMAMQEQSDSIPQNRDICQEFKANLELLKQDYEALRTFGKDCSLDANILQLQTSLEELESSFRAESAYPEPQRSKAHLTRISNESRKMKNRHSTFLQSARRIVWPPPPASDDRVASVFGDNRLVTVSNSNNIRSGNKDEQTSKLGYDHQSILSRSAIRVPPNNDQLANWSISYFGKLEANMFIDKTVRTMQQNVIRSEQNPNFSLCGSSATSDWHPESATSYNHHGARSNLAKNSPNGEENLETVTLGCSSTRRFDGPNSSENAPPSNGKQPAPNTQETSIRCKRRGGAQAGNTDVQLKESKINLQSKANNITKLKVLSKLLLADKKAHDLHKKSGEILSRIYAPNDSKRPPNVYY